MKALALFMAVFAISTLAEASPIRLSCLSPKSKTAAIDLVVDSKAVTQPGVRPTKVSGLYYQQSLTSTVNPTSKRIQMTLNYQTGQTMTLVEARNATEAAVLFESAPRPFFSQNGMVPTGGKDVAMEFERYYGGIQRNVYLMLLMDHGQDTVTYAGFCRLSYNRP